MEENLKVREQQSEGTTEFLTNQLDETRKTLEEQEGKLRDFRLQHIGEMPEQQTADLQILGQLQSQLQLVGEALNRAESQKSTIQAMVSAQSAPVVDMDQVLPRAANGPEQAKGPAAPGQSALARQKAELAEKLKRYGEDHPDIRKLESSDRRRGSTGRRCDKVGRRGGEVRASRQSDGAGICAAPTSRLHEPGAAVAIKQHRTRYRAKSGRTTTLEQGSSKLPGKARIHPRTSPTQEIAEMTRDYEISKVHYSQILSNQMNAETATQLENRQKGEKFSVLYPAQPAGRPSRPGRPLAERGGQRGRTGSGGLLFALVTEFLGVSITSAEQLATLSGFQVLETIPLIQTQAGRLARRRRVVLAVAGVLASGLALGGGLLYYYRTQLF